MDKAKAEFTTEHDSGASDARKKALVVIPDCDHQFQGLVNGKIMSKAPFWAFADDESFPSPEGGTILYE